ncbi:MAG: PAS domain-containing protein [Nitrospirae bacterium]|nr:PAS domain-containing protein [Nitrospirota bacterium]
MKRILFKRILFLYLIITPLLVLPLQFYLSSVIKNSYLFNLRENLIIQAHLIAEKIQSVSAEINLDEFCRTYKEKTGSRITIIDNSGRVLGDSDESSRLMENHLNRPEIRDAMISDTGSSIRFSKTISKNFFYLAISVNQEPNRFFLRLSVPLQHIEKAINEIRMKIIVGALLVLFIVIMVGLIQTERITKSIEEITLFSKDVASGNFRKRLFLKEKGELGELGKNINEMAKELSFRLQQSEDEKNKIEAILRNMSDGLLLTDKKGIIILSNDAVARLFGLTSSIEGKTLLETLRKAELMELIEKVIETGDRISLEIEISYPKEIHLVATAAPFSIKSEVTGVVITFHDISRLKKLENIRKDFVANVSHEMKTPVTAIKGFAETLLEGALDEKENARKFIETIKAHSERLNSLVSDLLTLSRIELGDIKIEKTTVNLNEVVDTVFNTLKEKAQKKGLNLEKQIPVELQEIQADRNRFIQILLNLVDNGIKFTEKGGVTVKVQSRNSSLSLRGEAEAISKGEISRSARNDNLINFIEISIEDTGIGIPKKHIPRLGERFYRVDTARSRELGGTGLGLAIVKHLVKAHGWDMVIESVEGKGTTVKIICTVT